VGGRTFVKFHLDVGVGDVVMDTPEHARMRDWLGFADIAAPDVPMIQREQQFAEKLHAYTVPRTIPNKRVRDLVDMVLPIQSGTLERGRVVQALHATFDRRATHRNATETRYSGTRNPSFLRVVRGCARSRCAGE
jgi:hypothetical protein